MSATFESRELKLVAKDYQLNYEFDFEQEKLFADGKITISNISKSNATHIPIRLYRMLSVSEIKDENGQPLKFSQQILSNEDWAVLQTNYIELLLDKPLKPGKEYSFYIKFEGYLRGYAETGMLYVKDHISKDFTIIRMDSFAYPVISYPNHNINSKVGVMLHPYDYDVSVTTPDDYVVANGGTLIEKSENNNQLTYRYKNKLPAWRMDFTIAHYQKLSKGKYSVFSWESKEDAQRMLDEVENTVNLYSKWFGSLANELGYTFIEIPENYGAQADVTSVLQTAVAFKGKENLGKVYHEISHQWNVKSLDQFSPRWNEGLATFLQKLTLDKLHLPGYLNKETDDVIKYLQKTFTKYPNYRTTAYIDYGKEKLNSYSVGMLFFRLMYDLTSQDEFNSLIGGFYQTFNQDGATTEQFIEYIKQNSKTNLKKLFDDWAYTTEYVKLIDKSKEYSEILAYY